jgi:hypothetical protein
VNPQKAIVASLNDQRLDRDQWWQVSAFPVQEADPFRYAPRWKIGFAEAADLDGSGESILQGFGDSLLREWPVPGQHNQHDARDEDE